MGKDGFLLWGYRPPRRLVRSGLGNLERQVIHIVWGSGEVTVREVCDRLGGRVAYTTVMTTLDRLFRKGLLVRTKRARAFLYAAATTREEFDDLVASDLASSLLSGELLEPLPFLSNLVEMVGERDGALLDELERMVRTKRRQLRRKEEP